MHICKGPSPEPLRPTQTTSFSNLSTNKIIFYRVKVNHFLALQVHFLHLGKKSEPECSLVVGMSLDYLRKSQEQNDVFFFSHVFFQFLFKNKMFTQSHES